MRIVLPAGKSFPPHTVAGEVTIQCIEGSFEVTADQQTHTLQAGHLLYLPGGVEHSLFGLENASGLVTIVLQK